MITKEPTRRGDKVKVTFVIPDSDGGGHVFVAGEADDYEVNEYGEKNGVVDLTTLPRGRSDTRPV